jgi:hypothetical protein
MASALYFLVVDVKEGDGFSGVWVRSKKRKPQISPLRFAPVLMNNCWFHPQIVSQLRLRTHISHKERARYGAPPIISSDGSFRY